MSALLFFSFLLLIHNGFGSVDLSRLLKTHPTWSFKVESVEAIIERAAQLRGNSSDPQVTMAKLRSAIEATFGPNTKHIVSKVADPKWPTEVPETFDARQKWKRCAKLISTPSDEGNCRSDAPAVAASVASDRYCIYKEEGPPLRFSPEILAGCAGSCTVRKSMSMYDALLYILSEGSPTGGAYNSNKGCLPWTEAPCKHTKQSYLEDNANVTMTKQACSKTGIEHACAEKCSNPAYRKSLDEDRIKAVGVGSNSNCEEAIMLEIFKYGPVAMNMRLYDDFLKHPKGIYKIKPGAVDLGAEKHFKVIGWGTEQGTDYWLAVNTWNYWGGYKVFKIARHQEEYVPLTAYTINFDWKWLNTDRILGKRGQKGLES